MNTENTKGTERGEDRAPIKKAAPRWIWISLISSLALNLLVVGVIAGAIWSWRHGGHWGRHGFGGPMSNYIRTLSDERRAEFRKSIRNHFPEMRPLWKSVRAARNNVSKSLKSEPFNRATFETAMETLRQAEFDARKAMTPVLSELASKLTLEERKKFLKHHSSRHKWRGRHHDEPVSQTGSDTVRGDNSEGKAIPPVQAP